MAALDLLPDAEREDFERACSTDVELARVREELQRTAALLPLGVLAVTPRPEMRARILMSLPPAPPGPSVIRLARLAVAPRSGALGFGRWLAAALAVAACIVLVALWRGEKQKVGLLEKRLSAALDQSNRYADEVLNETAQSRQLAAALEAESAQTLKLTAELNAAREKSELLASEAEAQTQELGVTRQKTIELEAQNKKIEGGFQLTNMQAAVLTSLVRTQPGARAVSLWDGKQQRGVLIVQGLPALPEDREYQLWVIDPQQKTPVDAGVFQVSADGQEQFEFKPKAEVSTGTFAVTVEPKGGVAAPTGQMVLKGN